MEALGHSQITMARDTNLHAMPATRREAAGLLGARLTGRQSRVFARVAVKVTVKHH